MNTLDINSRVIRTVLSKTTDLSDVIEPDRRGRHNSRQCLDEVREGIRQFLRCVPKLPSHYCRANSSREYIDGSKTIAELHRDFVSECTKNNQPSGKYQFFREIFKEDFDLSFFITKKDQCPECTVYDNASGVDKQSLVESYEKHILEKDLARKEKENDKENSPANTIFVCYDMQAVFQCPKGNASVFYYKSKLNVLNLTFYELKTKAVTCYVWHEGEADRGVNEIESCVLKFIEEKVSAARGEIDIIFYSDNCSGQQKNKFMISLYQYAIRKHPNIKSISHKFLIRGHTQNEGDSAHSTIEREVNRILKGGPIFTPDQFIAAIRSAKKNWEDI